MLLKASCITNLTDARYFAAREVDFLGFNLEEGSMGYLEPMYMKAIREWVEGPQIIGEFQRSDEAYLQEAAVFLGLDGVQCPCALDQKWPDTATFFQIKIKDYSPETITQQFAALPAPQDKWLLLDFEGSDWTWEQVLDSSFWKAYLQTHPALLQIDAPATAYTRLWEVLRPAGFSFVGGAEEAVGVKSFDELESVFEVLESHRVGQS
jgi:phosphoribosylanthranilate isomerase